MTPLRAHGRLVPKGDKLLVLGSSPSRRIVFFVIFVVFTLGMIAGIDPTVDFTSRRLLGTVMYVAILAVSLGVAAWSKQTFFDAEKRTISTHSSFFGIPVKKIPGISFAEVHAVVLQKVQLLKSRDMPFKRSGALTNVFEPRSQLFRLFLETDEQRVKLEESSYREEIERQAGVLAEFLGVSLKNEEL